MHETDESGKGIRLRTSARRMSRGQRGVRKICRPRGNRESRIVGELSMLTQPSMPEIPQPIFNLSSAAAAAACGFNTDFLFDFENAQRYTPVLPPVHCLNRVPSEPPGRSRSAP